MSEVEKEEKLEMAENVGNFLDFLSKDVDLVVTNFTEIYKRISQVDKNSLDTIDKNQVFELGEKIGVISASMKMLNKINKIYDINKKEIITEMIKNLDSFSSILMNFEKNDINAIDLQNLEQRMLTFFDFLMEFLENILRK